jgi:hypothetical protein
MEDRDDRKRRTAADVRDLRATNKVFGLSNAERWSGCQQLIDFIDDLFSAERSAMVKIKKPVRIVLNADGDKLTLSPVSTTMFALL